MGKTGQNFGIIDKQLNFAYERQNLTSENFVLRKFYYRRILDFQNCFNFQKNSEL